MNYKFLDLALRECPRTKKKSLKIRFLNFKLHYDR